MMLFFYRARPYGVLGVSPVSAMFGWKPFSLLISGMHEDARYDSASWTVALHDKAVAIRDYVAKEMVRHDGECKEAECPYKGDRVMVRWPTQKQKCLALLKPGWQVCYVASPATVVIVKDADQRTVNVELIK